jgi:hypothetical protein
MAIMDVFDNVFVDIALVHVGESSQIPPAKIYHAISPTSISKVLEQLERKEANFHAIRK